MPFNTKIWGISEDDNLREIKKSKLNLEERIENWLEKDISTLSDDLLIIGRQIKTDFGGIIDLLCLDRNGDAVIVELKRNKTPRDITAQVLDYASWVKDLSNDRITEIADRYLGENGPLEEAFKRKFSEEFPETLNAEHNMLIVASEIDASSERIINYLSDNYGVGINAATFQYYKEDEKEYLSRVFLIEPSEVEYKSKTKASSKRNPNLTYKELEDIADNNKVGDLYRNFTDKLLNYFEWRSTTRSSIVFGGKLEEKQKVIISFIPQESNLEEGLRFQIYINRISEFFKIEKEKAISLLPENRTEWKYYEAATDDWSGYAGYFKNIKEIEKFINGLRS